jgi:acyl carrier protein
MSEQAVLETVQKIIFQVTGKKHITSETDFIKDLELNSFDIMNIVCAFEDHYDTTVPTRDVWQMHQVRDVIDYMIALGITE